MHEERAHIICTKGKARDAGESEDAVQEEECSEWKTDRGGG